MFKNKEFKFFTISYFVLCLVLGIVLFFLLDFSIDKLEDNYYEELISSVNDTDMLEESGKLSFMPSEYSESIKESIIRLYIVVYIIYMFICIGGFILSIHLYKFPLKAIHKVQTNAADVLEGNYNNLDLKDIDESDISQFYSMYTKMVTAIKVGREKEQNERIFLQDLIADISHQLKTPLATLTIYQDLLSNPDISDSKRKEILSMMGDQLSRMEWLILSLLKLARLESGAIEFNVKKQPLLPTLQLAAQNVSMLSNAKSQVININCDTEILLSHDQDWLAECLTNILKNATEYAPEGSNIEVWTDQSPLTTMIHIKDYGKGIDKESQSKIFKRFYRAKSDVNANSIGIGLSLSKSIVEGQGGDIMVESEPGKYTCFTITFYHALSK